eukprot:TRINITY_DN12658_c0_g1_i1.p1 TRINITY_DN12658_c0_g1~~TRINITY_DN12658_c0_g1_i1.p1  ORF type:complete len:328 (-),score=196.24 TRINITY_DN12658_c0_g1_i1:29-889(-)
MNALKTLTVVGMAEAVEVVPGQGKPLLRPAVHSEEIHGESGLDGPLFPPITAKANTSVKAVTRMFEVLREHRCVTIVATGPLTNVALLLILYPEARRFIEKVVIMGGAMGMGNTGPAAEFNIQVDPEAAHVVFNSHLHVVMVPLEVTHTNLVTPAVLDRIRELDSEFADMVVTLLTFFADSYRDYFGFDSPPLHDPCTIAYVIDPTLFHLQFMRVDVELASPLSIGQTVCDVHGVRQHSLPKNVHVATKMNVEGFFDLMMDALRKCDQRSPLNKEHKGSMQTTSKL